MNILKLYYYRNDRLRKLSSGTTITLRELTYKQRNASKGKKGYDKYIPAEGVLIDKLIINGDDEDEGDEPKSRMKIFNTTLSIEINEQMHLTNSSITINIRSMQSVNQRLISTRIVNVGDSNTLDLDLSSLNRNLIYNLEIFLSGIVHTIYFRV